MRALVTGAAGFIGFHLAQALLEQGAEVVGIDNLNDYYSVRLKEDRLARLTPRAGFHWVRGDLADAVLLDKLFVDYEPTHVVNLAAQAGVRYSLINPQSYIQSNLVGFANLLECCRHHKVTHLLFASSSSVYGLNRAMPYRVEDNVDHPVSLYAATKKAMNSWPMPTAICTAFPARAYVFYGIRPLGTTGHGASSVRFGHFGGTPHQSVQSRPYAA